MRRNRSENVHGFSHCWHYLARMKTARVTQPGTAWPCCRVRCRVDAIVLLPELFPASFPELTLSPLTWLSSCQFLALSPVGPRVGPRCPGQMELGENTA